MKVHTNRLQSHKFPVDRYQKQVKDELKTLKDRGLFTEGEYRTMWLSNPVIPQLYGLPKTHKEGNKMRTICSNVNAPASLVAKKLVAMNRSLTIKSGFGIKNSKELIECLKDIKIRPNEELCSFDVTALYPSVPTNEA
jgi:hypothetical protein